MNQRIFLKFQLKKVLCLSFLILSIVNTPAYATEIKGLYSASVRVETQTFRERRTASQDALAEVFVRVSGNPDIIKNEELLLSLSKADQLTTSYAYHAIEQNDKNDSTDNNKGQGFLLSLDFDSVQVNKTLRAANLPVWGSNRPQLLMWWAIEDKKGRRLVNSDKDERSRKIIEAHAKRRGIPLTWPLLDLTDKQSISTSDVWQLQMDRVLLASKRYGAQAVIMGRTRMTGAGRWFGSWSLLINGEQFWLDGEGSSLDSVMQQAVDFAANILAEHYAVTQSSENSDGIMLKITGINTLSNYAKLNNYLAGLSSVERFTLTAVHQNNVWYSLILESDIANFEQTIRLNNVLKKRVNESELQIDESRLEYQWTGL